MVARSTWREAVPGSGERHKVKQEERTSHRAKDRVGGGGPQVLQGRPGHVYYPQSCQLVYYTATKKSRRHWKMLPKLKATCKYYSEGQIGHSSALLNNIYLAALDLAALRSFAGMWDLGSPL